MIKPFVICILLMAVKSQDLTVGIDYQVVFGSSINHISWGRDDNYWVCFGDGTVGKYNWDFNQSTIYDIRTECNFRSDLDMWEYVGLSNGDWFDMKGQYAFYESASQRQVHVYSLPDHHFIESHQFSGPFKQIYRFGIPLNDSHATYAVGLMENSLQIALHGQTHTIEASLAPAKVVTALLYTGQIWSELDEVYRRIKFLYATEDSKLYTLQTQICFRFSHVTGRMEYNHTKTVTTIEFLLDTADVISTILMGAGMIYLENTAATVAYVFKANTTANYVNSVTPISIGKPVSEFVYYNSARYALVSNALVKLIYNWSSMSLAINYTTSTLPSSVWGLAVGDNSTALYEPGRRKIYFPFPVIVPQIIEPLLPQWQGFLAMLLSLLSSGGSVPGGRRFISPLFRFFGVFDDMYLLQFHNRDYGDTMKSVFEHINEVEQNKWSLINYNKVLSWVGANQTDYKEFTEYQAAYQTSPSTASGSEGQEEALVANCHNFFIVALPITIICFVLFNTLFRLSRNHPASLIFRKFDFLAFLFILLFDGNVQQFAFYFASQVEHLFFFTLSQRLLKLFILLFGMLLTVGSICFYLICLSLYRKLNRILMDNNSNTLLGSFLLIAQVSFRNFILGLLNSVLRCLDYPSMLAILLLIDCLFTGLFAAFISCHIYKIRIKVWVYLVLNVLKLGLMVSLFADYQAVNSPMIEAYQQITLFVQLVVFSGGVIVESIDCINEAGLTISVIFSPKQVKSTKNSKNSKGQMLKIVPTRVKQTHFKTRQSRQKRRIKSKVNNNQSKKHEDHSESPIKKEKNRNQTYQYMTYDRMRQHKANIITEKGHQSTRKKQKGRLQRVRM